jgi:hypothetical protein
MKRKTISDPVGYTRLTATRGLKSRGSEKPVERDGGKYGAGLIRGASIITRGEALGHRAWIDETTLQQVADSINAAGDKGVKSRFTHPSLSGDGLGTALGRAIGPAEVRSGQVIADLHLSKSAHTAPSGDLAGYTMDLAEESPESFGTSIVFTHDKLAEDAFADENQAEVEHEDGKGRKRKGYEFRSPDPDNVNNYRHVRLKALHAVDAVDDPAANPAGLFTRGQDIPQQADALLSFCLGLTSDRPDCSKFGVDPDRAAAFVARFLESRNLSLKGEEKMAKENAAPVESESKPAVTRETFAAELKRYTDAFGAENGQQWFAEGKPMADCYAEHCKAQAEALKAANDRADKAEKALAEVKRGEAKPVSAGGDNKPKGLPIRVKD